MAHSYEEIRAVALDILANREHVTHDANQYQNLLIGIGEVLARRNPASVNANYAQARRMVGDLSGLSEDDKNTFQEVFWDLFRQGIITLGCNNSNPDFPFFRLSSSGRRAIANQQLYFFHDVSTYEKLIRTEIPEIDDVTLVYLKEAMQAFRVGCILSASVMLGVATEHTFDLLMEAIQANPTHAATFQSVSKERGILNRVNKFKAILDNQLSTLPPRIKEDLDTHFAGILSIIRNFRNQSGHPTGKIIDREQAYVLLNLFVPYGRKIYQIKSQFS